MAAVHGAESKPAPPLVTHFGSRKETGEGLECHF